MRQLGFISNAKITWSLSVKVPVIVHFIVWEELFCANRNNLMRIIRDSPCLKGLSCVNCFRLVEELIRLSGPELHAPVAPLACPSNRLALPNEHPGGFRRGSDPARHLPDC